MWCMRPESPKLQKMRLMEFLRGPPRMRHRYFNVYENNLEAEKKIESTHTVPEIKTVLPALPYASARDKTTFPDNLCETYFQRLVLPQLSQV